MVPYRLSLGVGTGSLLQPLNSSMIAVALVAISADLDAAGVTGDPALVERLVANLVENAIHHNDPGGWVKVRTSANGSGAVLRVSNNGVVVPDGEAAHLVDPFRRRNGERTRHANGVGLGLSIVQAIAVAHDATLRVTPRSEGGLEVEVAFPPVSEPV